MRRVIWMICGLAVMQLLAGCGDDDMDDLLGAAIAFDNTLGQMYCDCFWEEEGFSDRSECLSYATWDSDERSEIEQCAAEVAEDVVAERTQGVDEYISCFSRAYDEGRSCMRSVDSGEMCSASWEFEIEACLDTTWDQLDDCEDEMWEDEDTRAWIREWDERMDSCVSL